jgi:hypothetical protein
MTRHALVPLARTIVSRWIEWRVHPGYFTVAAPAGKRDDKRARVPPQNLWILCIIRPVASLPRLAAITINSSNCDLDFARSILCSALLSYDLGFYHLGINATYLGTIGNI